MCSCTRMLPHLHLHLHCGAHQHRADRKNWTTNFSLRELGRLEPPLPKTSNRSSQAFESLSIASKNSCMQTIRGINAGYSAFAMCTQFNVFIKWLLIILMVLNWWIHRFILTLPFLFFTYHISQLPTTDHWWHSEKKRVAFQVPPNQLKPNYLFI